MSKKTEKENSQKDQQSNNEKSSVVEEKVKKEQLEKNDKEQLQTEIANLRTDKLRLLAEIDNKQKEFRRQMEEVYKYSNKSFIQWVLNFLIDLEERALKAMRNDSEQKVKNHLVGIEMMRDNLWKNLENEGVKEMKIAVENDIWNSHFYELVEEVENDKLPEGTVVEVIEKGYLFHDRILRPAKVKISKKTK